jgi:SAM-dependent methyltransferase
MQTIALARATSGPITAVDVSLEYLDELEERSRAAHVTDRIRIVAADMNRLPFVPASFDAIWSEGAAYIMGLERALTAWKQFLRPSGFIAVTELVWLRADPPAEVAEFFSDAYPAMADVEQILRIVQRRGYDVLGHFTLPDRAWWTDYYAPLESKLPHLFRKYGGDEEALAIVEAARREIEVRRSYPQSYGYEFFVGRLAGTG